MSDVARDDDKAIYEKIKKILYWSLFSNREISNTNIEYLDFCANNYSEIYNCAFVDVEFEHNRLLDGFSEGSIGELFRPWLGNTNIDLSKFLDSSMNLANVGDANSLIRGYLNTENKNIFVCQVDGDSMIGANIFDGDLLVVERCENIPESGTIAVISLNSKVFVKRLFCDRVNTILVSENIKYRPYRVGTNETFKILGAVKGIIHKV
jgi:DNA polymerase V